jgi:hypothetical protein
MGSSLLLHRDVWVVMVPVGYLVGVRHPWHVLANIFCVMVCWAKSCILYSMVMERCDKVTNPGVQVMMPSVHNSFLVFPVVIQCSVEPNSCVL